MDFPLICKICDKGFTGEIPFNNHVASRKHLQKEHQLKVKEQLVLNGIVGSSQFDSVEVDGQSAEGESASTAAAIHPPRRLRKAESILANRTTRFLLVIERSYDLHNQYAVLRTAECLGIQNVWMVESPAQKVKKLPTQSHLEVNHKIARQSANWLSIRTFNTTTECIKALREDNREIWVTDLSQLAVDMTALKEQFQKSDGNDNDNSGFPKRLAIVIGRETDGASQEILDAADLRVYLPIFGFTESLNLSVATAMVLQTLFFLCPEAKGDMSEEERDKLRADWYSKLARSEAQQKEYDRWLANPPAPFLDLRRPEEHRVVWVQKKTMERVEDKQGVNGSGDN